MSSSVICKHNTLSNYPILPEQLSRYINNAVKRDPRTVCKHDNSLHRLYNAYFSGNSLHRAPGFKLVGNKAAYSDLRPVAEIVDENVYLIAQYRLLVFVKRMPGVSQPSRFSYNIVVPRERGKRRELGGTVSA